jgi:hypothetical protein
MAGRAASDYTKIRLAQVMDAEKFVIQDIAGEDIIALPCNDLPADLLLRCRGGGDQGVGPVIRHELAAADDDVVAGLATNAVEVVIADDEVTDRVPVSDSFPGVRRIRFSGW